MRVGNWAGILGASLLVAACQTAIPPVEVTRFHVPEEIGRGTISVEPAAYDDDVSLEFRGYTAAVGRELQRLGFTEAQGSDSQYVAAVHYTRTTRDPMAPRRSPVSVGVGGATGSYGSGLGVGIGINLSGPPKAIIVTQLNVQIRRRSDSSVLWEGRAITEAKENAPAAQPGMAAAKLAEALFRDFPGASGRTITVK